MLRDFCDEERKGKEVRSEGVIYTSLRRREMSQHRVSFAAFTNVKKIRK
jgi:hypothetical protein